MEFEFKEIDVSIRLYRGINATAIRARLNRNHRSNKLKNREEYRLIILFCLNDNCIRDASKEDGKNRKNRLNLS